MIGQLGLRDFDKVAAGWDQEPRRVALARAVADAVVAQVRPSAAMRGIDFGCGTGLVTLALAPFLGEIVAMDSSAGMLQQLSIKLAQSGITNVTPLLVPSGGSMPWPAQMDLVVSSMTLHHLAEVEGMIRRFHDLLVPGGYLCIADLESEDGSFHDDPTGIQHHGFASGDMERWFRGAGFAAVRTLRVHEVQKNRDGRSLCYPVNLTIGRRDD